MTFIRRITKCATKKFKTAIKNPLFLTQHPINNFEEAMKMAYQEVRNNLEQNYKCYITPSSNQFNETGERMLPLQTSSQGYSGIMSSNNDFSKMDSESFVHAMKKEDPADFRLADIEEVQSVIIEDKPKKSLNATMDKELV